MRRVRGRVRRLARELPAFDQVWIDALVQARHLTPFQAEMLAEGNASQLALGAYVLCERLGASDLGETFRARHRSKLTQQVVIRRIRADAEEFDQVRERLAAHVEALAEVISPSIAVPFELIDDDGLLCLVEPFVPGPSPLELLTHRGRIQPSAVVEIARQLLATLEGLSDSGTCHGDLRPASLKLSERGMVVVTGWGLRQSIPGRELVPERGLLPERFDYQPRERYAPGHPYEVSGDLYALGCVLYHLLAGRPPFPGDALAKVMSHQSRRVPDVSELVPDTPPLLAETIRTLTEPDPANRTPDGIAKLVERLGQPSRRSRQALVRYLGGKDWRCVGRRPKPTPSRLKTALAFGLVVIAVAFAVVSGAGKQRAGRWLDAALAAAQSLLPDATGSKLSPLAPTTVSIPGPRELVHKPSDVVPNPTNQRSGPPERLEAVSPTRVGVVGGRRTFFVSHKGLEVTRPGQVFKDLDVRLAPLSSASGNPPEVVTTLVSVGAPDARFVGCRFFGSAPVGGRPFPVAIDWKASSPNPRSGDEESRNSSSEVPPTLTFEHCIFDGVAAAVLCEAGTSATVRFENCLMLGPGPFVSFARFPSEGSRAKVAFEGSTLRSGEAAIRIAGSWSHLPPGKIEVLANDCVFAATSGLLLFGPGVDEAFQRNVSWAGIGTLISNDTPAGVRFTSDDERVALDGSELVMEGIVPAALRFRRNQPRANRPEDSEIRDAAGAPSFSGRTPGIDPSRLPSDRAVARRNREPSEKKIDSAANSLSPLQYERLSSLRRAEKRRDEVPDSDPLLPNQ